MIEILKKKQKKKKFKRSPLNDTIDPLKIFNFLSQTFFNIQLVSVT